jgi:hypothetical protein
MKGVQDLYGTRSCVNAHVRDHQHHCNASRRCASIDKKRRDARSTDFTRLSCDSNLRVSRALDAYSDTADRQSTHKNVALERVNPPVKKI